MIRWSRIHANLAEPQGDLTFAHIQAALDAGMTEAADLDWKAGIPPAQSDEALTEFAKDVAAMANSGGGLLVYGIKEDRGTGEAAAIKSVDGSDEAQRRLRQALNARIRPLVSGLDMIPLVSPDGQSTVLVLAVPRSPDVPHFVGDRKRSMGAPYRMGAQTDWLSETQIARAYADRFSLRESEQERLGRMVAEAGAQLDFSQGTWLVGVARPAVPTPVVRRSLPRNEIRTLLEDALHTSNLLTPNASPTHRYRLIRNLGTAIDNPRIGLRRWVIQTREHPDLGSSGVHVELHHDGSLVLAAAAGSNPTIGVGVHQIFAPFVESFAADFTALVDSYARHLGDSVPAAFRVDLMGLVLHSTAVVTDHRRSPGAPISSQVERVPGTIALRELTPIVSETPALVRDVIAMQTMARSIAEDVLHQFSMGRLSVLPSAL